MKNKKIKTILKLIIFLPYLLAFGTIIYILFFYQEKTSASFISGKALGIVGVLIATFYYTIFLVGLFLIIFLIKKIKKFFHKIKRK